MAAARTPSHTARTPVTTSPPQTRTCVCVARASHDSGVRGGGGGGCGARGGCARLSLPDFGREVDGRAAESVGSLALLGQPKVRQLDVAVGVEQHILGLE
eukprot:76416-Prymnesium_polylepis.1